MPNALPRSFGSVNVVVSSDSAAGTSSARERALAGPRRDQHGEVDRGAADGRDAGEAGQAGQERHLAAEQVGQPAAEQQQAAERQRVGGDHPLPVRGGEAQRPLRRRQRDVHHRDVQHHHELRQADDAQDQPPAGVESCAGPGGAQDGGGGRCSWLSSWMWWRGLRGASGGGDAAAGSVGVGVLEHVAGPFAGGDGQDELGVGAGVAHGDPRPAVGGRPPQADLDAGAAAAVQLPRQMRKDVAHTLATNEHPAGGQRGSELFETPGQEPLLGGRSGQLERPAVGRSGLVLAAETPQQLAAGGVEVELAEKVEPVDRAQRGGDIAGLGERHGVVEFEHR